MPKRYNTPHRSHVVKTRLTDEEYADFTERLAPYGISQSEFLRQAIRRTTIRPVLHVSSVNDELLSAVGKLTAEYGRIGGNLNQIARTLNEWHSPYPAMAKELREAAADLAALKYEVLKKVGDAVGNAQRGVTVRYTPQHQAARAAEQTAAIPEYLHAGKGRLQGEKTGKIDPRQDSVQRLVDIEQKMAEGKGKGYERWAKIHNLKQAAKTLTIYQQYGFSSPEQLEAAVATAYQEMRQTSGELKALETKLQGKRELRQQVLAYAKTKPIREGLKAQKSEKARAAYRQANESDFIIAEAAARYFKAQGLTKLPGRKALQAEIEQLISEKDGLYNTYHEQKQRFRELQTVKRNIDQILRREEPHRRKEQSHER